MVYVTKIVINAGELLVNTPFEYNTGSIPNELLAIIDPQLTADAVRGIVCVAAE